MEILAKYIGTDEDDDFHQDSAYIFEYCVDTETGKIQIISFMQKELMIVKYENKKEFDRDWEVLYELEADTDDFFP